MTSTNEAQEWLAAYARAWEQGDPGAAAALFTEDCSYRSLIFAEPHRERAGVRAYWQRATGTQSGVGVRMGEPLVSGSTVVAEWWTTMTGAEDGEMTLPGVLLLAFDGAGLCRRLREYWGVGPGRTEPPEHWGRLRTGGHEFAAEFARPWAERYTEAWHALDAAAVPALFSEDALYASHPLREPQRGRDGVRAYTERAFGDCAPGAVEARLAVVATAGRAAAVEYWATLVDSGEPTTLAGCDLLAFDEQGRCTTLRDYWHQAPGHLQPPQEWGR